VKMPPYLNLFSLSTTQCQLFIYLIHRSFRVRAMFPRPGAAARMVRNFDQREVDHAKKLRLGSAQLHED